MLAQSLFHSLLSIFVICLVSGFIIGCGDETPLEPDPINGNGIDTIPPARITGLYSCYPTQSTLALVWVAPGDDGDKGQAAAYEIRHAGRMITEDNWAWTEVVTGIPAPQPAGKLETFVVKGLNSGADHYFAIKTYDEVPNESALSNCASGLTVSESTPPADVQDLSAYASSATEFLVTFTAPGDDGNVGRAIGYDFRYSLQSITAANFYSATAIGGLPAPSPAGETESIILTSLSTDFNYYFSVKTVDNEGNWSGISNTCMALGYTEYLMADPTLIYPSQVGADILIMFRSDSSAERIVITISKNVWNGDPEVIRLLVDGNFSVGVHTAIWDWKDDQGELFLNWPFGNLLVEIYVDGVAKDDLSLRKM